SIFSKLHFIVRIYILVKSLCLNHFYICNVGLLSSHSFNDTTVISFVPSDCKYALKVSSSEKACSLYFAAIKRSFLSSSLLPYASTATPLFSLIHVSKLSSVNDNPFSVISDITCSSTVTELAL